MALLESDMGSSVNDAAKAECILRLVQRLSTFLEMAVANCLDRGEPHSWPEYSSLSRFTAATLMRTWNLHDREVTEEDFAIWLWNLCNDLYCARRNPSHYGQILLNPAGPPIEREMMLALTFEGDDVLEVAEIEQSPLRSDLPSPSSLWELWGLPPVEPPPAWL
jgi:hypothetical protein